MEYNPFRKPISEIQPEDLGSLVSERVSEGWQIEYKSGFTDNLKIAQAIASFANSEGGWLVIGVKGDKLNEAVEIRGIESSANTNYPDKIRDIVIGHIKPVPIFKTGVVPLPDGMVVVLVRVEEGDETPYITSDGVVYQRTGAGKRPIKDRHDLDRLFERASNANKAIERFCQNPFMMSQRQADSNQCSLEMYLWPTPFGESRFENFFEKEFVEELIATFTKQVPVIVNGITSDLGLNSFSSGGGSYIFRQKDAVTALNLGLTVEIFRNGGMKVFFPVPQVEISRGNVLGRYINVNNYEKFISLLPEENRGLVKIINGFSLFLIVHVLIGQYCRLIKAEESSRNVSVKVRLGDCWRTLLYLDAPGFIDFINKNGLPIGCKDEIELPGGSGLGFPITLSPKSSIPIVCNIYEALGLPMAFVQDALSGIGNYLEKVVSEASK